MNDDGGFPNQQGNVSAPFAEAVAAEAESDNLAFHMPGHRNGRGVSSRARELLGEQLFDLDRSEMGGLDYLHSATSEMALAQRLAASTFGARQSWFLVGGSTVGNHAALLGVVGDGDRVLVPRATHRSVHAALALSGAQPVWVPSAYDVQRRGWFEPDFAAAARLGAGHGEIRAVHLTRPTYYGVAVDLRPWIELSRSLGAVLIVDEAHGSHLGLHPSWPASALKSGADLVIQSTHKTLGALTQAAMLHLGVDSTVDAARVGRMLALLQSSSPSVLLTASLDLARAHIDAEGPALGEQLDKLSRGVVRELRRAGVPVWAGLAGQDPTKIVVDAAAVGLTGIDVAQSLRHGHGVIVELADLDHVVCSLTIADDESTCQRLVEALQSALMIESGMHRQARSPLAPGPIPPQRMSLRDAMRLTGVSVTREASLGRVATEFVIPYPPGIPLVVPGEELTIEVLQSLDASVAAGSKIVGPSRASAAALPLVVDSNHAGATVDPVPDPDGS